MKIDKTSIAFMKEYLGYVVEFEKYVYMWKKALNTASGQLKQITKDKNQLEYKIRSTTKELDSYDTSAEREIAHKKTELVEYKEKLKRATRPRKIVTFIGIGFIAIGILRFLVTNNIDFLFAGGAIAFIILLLTFAFGMDAGFAESEHIKQLTEELKILTTSNQSKRQKVLLDEQRKNLNSELVVVNQHYLQAGNNESNIHETLRKAQATLNEIYAMNVLPTKYRSLNAAATLYEYLNTGRCTQIQGHGGIYDTYEYDLKLGLIINKLDEISSKLDIIVSNQQLLYSELRNVNQNLSKIDKELCSFQNSFKEYAESSLQLQRQTAATVQWAAWNDWASGRI